MPTTQELFTLAESLPVEARANLADRLLKSLNPPDESIERQWIGVAKKRLEEIRTGAVQTIPGDVVFRKIQELLIP